MNVKPDCLNVKIFLNSITVLATRRRIGLWSLTLAAKCRLHSLIYMFQGLQSQFLREITAERKNYSPCQIILHESFRSSITF